MKKFLYMAVAAIAALSSCTSDDIVVNENQNQNQNGKAPVFTATIEGEALTRTQLVEGSTAGELTKVAWLNTDEVFIYGAGQTELSVAGNYNVTNIKDAIYATLTPGSSLRYNNPEVTMVQAHAFYPASISRINKENIDVATMYANKLQRLKLLQKANQYYLPTTQKYNGTDISQIAPMIGLLQSGTNEPEISFINATALLAITVPATECLSVKEIVVSSDQRMCGYYQLNGDNTIAPVTDEAAIKSVTLDCTDKSYNWTYITTGQSKTFYISIPPATYGNLKIDINMDGTNHYTMDTKAGADITVERNKIYPITFEHNGEYSYEEAEGGLWD